MMMSNSSKAKRGIFSLVMLLGLYSAEQAIAEGNAASSLEIYDEFVPNGNGTVSYQVHLRNHGEQRTCCQVSYDWMDTRFAVHQDQQAICVYPGHDEWVGAQAVTGGVGCIHTFGGKDKNGVDTSALACSSGGSGFKFKYRVHDCW
jgi:hypothetical protein